MLHAVLVVRRDHRSTARILRKYLATENLEEVSGNRNIKGDDEHFLTFYEESKRQRRVTLLEKRLGGKVVTS